MLPLALIFAALLAGHALADGPLQYGLASYKRRALNPWWLTALAAHAGIHSMFVTVITGSLLCGAGELVAHAAIDFLKCEKKINTFVDQSLHVACKVVWIALLAWGVS